jgi:hypothetical protein
MVRDCLWIGLLVFAWVFLGSVAGAAPGGVGGSAAEAVGSGVGGSAVQVMGYGVAIALLLGAGLVVLFKGQLWGGLIGGMGGGRGLRKLQIEETRMLGHRQYLVVAEYEGRRMLLGVCPGRIDYLCPLDGEGEAMSSGAAVFPKAEGEAGV